MAAHFSANQYDDAFRARALQQYTVPKQYKKYPDTRSGNTEIIGDDDGHILPGVPRSNASPWGNFVGTWDMPTRVPGNHLSNPCARRQQQPEAEMAGAIPAAFDSPKVTEREAAAAASPRAAAGAAGGPSSKPLSPVSPEPRLADPRLPTPLEKAAEPAAADE